MIETVFFDAGGTLVFPDLSLTIAPLNVRGIPVTQEQLFAAERVAKRSLDDARLHGLTHVDATYWTMFYDELLRNLAVADDSHSLRDALVRATRTGTNWKVVRPGTREFLARLHGRYRMGVISNSDGSIGKLIAEMGLADCFDSITDSHLCGCEKPDPRIFQAALATLSSTAETSLYVGDIYSVDYVGATNAGLSALLMDPAGTYAGTDYARVSSLAEVEGFLAARRP